MKSRADQGEGSSEDRDSEPPEPHEPHEPPRAGELAPASWVIAGGRDHRPGAPLNVPIVTASNFRAGSQDAVYSREDGTETLHAVEEVLGGLDAGDAVSFGSGMAAAAAVFHSLPPNAVVALPEDCYHGVVALARDGAERCGWDIRRIDTGDTESWRRSLLEADLVWLESPSNPLLVVADLPRVLEGDRRADSTVCVDGTFATPLLQRPLELGADLVMHSTTKFLGGHSDLLGGALVARTPELAARIRRVRTITGAVPGALESFLLLRGLRTLSLRMDRSQATAGELAQRLEGHGEVARVRYPGLPSHPTHEVARRTLAGFGAVFSFEVTGTAERAEQVSRELSLIVHATSLGGVESTIERRAGIAGQEHLPATLLRLSVGCEDPEDLWRDLERALSRTAS